MYGFGGLGHIEVGMSPWKPQMSNLRILWTTFNDYVIEEII